MNVFLIGAGFTKAVFPISPLNGELIQALSDKFPASVAPTLRDMYNTEDIEAALTKLDVDISSSQNERLRKLRKDIENELAKLK